MTSEYRQRPEGHLIGAAAKAKRLSARKAASRAGMSDARWRQIVNGYQSVAAGQVVPVIGPAETIARMAAVAGVSAEQLREAGRPDAASVMSEPWTPDLGTQAAAVMEDQLNPALAEFTDYELVSEVSTRMLLMAARLHAHGDESLSFVTDPETGRNVVTSRPVR